MKKAHWLALFLAPGLLVALFGTLRLEVAQPARAGMSEAAVQPQTLGPLIDIWTGDGVINLSPAVAYNSLHDEYLVVWWNYVGQTRGIYARRVGSDGTLKSWFAVASGADKDRREPAVAYSPAQDEYLIVYQYEYGPGDDDLYAKRVKWDGSWMSGELVINQDLDRQWYPAVAYNSQDDEYLVVYQNWWAGGLNDIAAQRVKASDGSLLSWANVATGAGEDRYRPDVAYNPALNQYLIAYGYYNGGPEDIRGKVAAANLAGVSVSPEIHICESADRQFWPAVAAGPNEYLVVWQDNKGSLVPWITWYVFGRRVSGDGIPQGSSSGFEISPLDNPVEAVDPDVAYGAGYGYLVVWSYERDTDSGPRRDDVYGRYVMRGQDSAAGDEFAIDEAEDEQNEPAVACAPSGDCLVVEHDYRLPPGDEDIRGRLVTPHRVYVPMVLRNYQ